MSFVHFAAGQFTITHRRWNEISQSQPKSNKYIHFMHYKSPTHNYLADQMSVCQIPCRRWLSIFAYKLNIYHYFMETIINWHRNKSIPFQRQIIRSKSIAHALLKFVFVIFFFFHSKKRGKSFQRSTCDQLKYWNKHRKGVIRAKCIRYSNGSYGNYNAICLFRRDRLAE